MPQGEIYSGKGKSLQIRWSEKKGMGAAMLDEVELLLCARSGTCI
jgi:hypothetical protein